MAALEKPFSASILFTHNLRGDLRFLPKLGRVLMQKRIEEKRTLTVDLGGTCAPDVWHCDATDGRSMLIALEGLNYIAVNAEGLPAEARPALSRSITHMYLIDDTHSGSIPGARFVARASDALDEFAVVLTPASEARVVGWALELPSIERYKIGRVRVEIGSAPEIVSVETFDVPPDTHPDPTLSGMIDFIESEARSYQRRKDKNVPPPLG